MTIHVENITSIKDRVDVVDLKFFGCVLNGIMNNDVWIFLCKCYCIHTVDNSIKMSLMIICFMQSTINDQIQLSVSIFQFKI